MVKERELEDYIVNELVGRSWRYVEGFRLERESTSSPLLKKLLRRKIKEFNPEVSEEDISEAISLLESKGYGPKGARDVLEYLKFGVPVKLRRTKTSTRIKLIDYENIDRNDFIVSNQVVHTGRGVVKNDIVLYVNGIPLVNIECKSLTDIGVSWYDAFLQIKEYEQKVPELYKYVQIGVAVESVAKYFPVVPWAREDQVPIYEWREEGLNSIDSTIEMLRPERLLDILRFFLYFRAEEGRETKVIARYMQYRAANKIVDRVLRRLEELEDKDRGLIWHWQGSGKTLTMIFAAMKLYWLLENPMILFVVDRIELQNQLYFENLTKLDLGPEVHPKLIDSIRRLQRVLSYNDFKGEPGLFVVLVHKFRPQEFEELEKLLLAVSATKPDTVMNRRDIVVFVDEAHRTQYGVLAEQMMRLLRKANYFAFTGTPVPRKNPQKNTFAKFSPPGELYLDKYFILDSIEDGYTVKIAYQPGPFDYQLDKDSLIEFLESEFDELPEEVRVRVERKIGRELDIKKFKVFLENEKRIDEIAKYIAKHFKENVDGKFKAMVVAASRKACVLYKKALDKYLPPKYSEVVMTFQAFEKERVIEEYKRELSERYHSKDLDSIRGKIIENFKTEEVPKILIVTDMLLTGFDAPILQTMYLDKPLKGHRLLQTIARVNRPYMGVKEFGLIIDFVGIFRELEKAFQMYEREDLRGAVYDIDSLYNEFRKLLQENIQIIGYPPQAVSKKDIFKVISSAAEVIAKSKDYERKFIGNYRKMRKIYEYISPVLSWNERKLYAWISDVYAFYIKNVRGSDEEEILARRYYKKTLQAISETLRVIEKEADFTPITVDKSFFEKFIKREDIGTEEKAKALIFGLTRFVLYERKDPIYESLADKINALLEEWRRRIRSSMELYEEARKIWEEIHRMREERKTLQFGTREYAIYLAFKKHGVDSGEAVKLTKELLEQIRDKVEIQGWTSNPALVKDVQRKVALFILRRAKKLGLTLYKAKQLTEEILRRIQEYET